MNIEMTMCKDYMEAIWRLCRENGKDYGDYCLYCRLVSRNNSTDAVDGQKPASPLPKSKLHKSLEAHPKGPSTQIIRL